MRHFTIIIPTRNRADTLRWSVESCLAQDYEQMTVLVSDNSSTDDTQGFLATISDSRLKVIRTPAPTSMSGNVEFALDHVLDQETHVTVFGDDDGLLPGALAYADDVLSRHSGTEVLTWVVSNYCWPNCLIDEWRNTLQLSFSDHAEVLSAPDMLAKLADYRVYYHHLPGLWTSLVPSSLVRQCKDRLGRIMISAIPDAASAVLFGCVAGSYLFSHRSISMLGSSSHSNGLAINQRKRRQLEQFLAENTIPPHGALDFADHEVYYVTESLLQARDRNLLPPNVTIDLPRALQLMLLKRPTDSDENSATIRSAAISTAVRHNIPFDADELIRRNEASGEFGKLFRDRVITRHASPFTHHCDPRITSNIFDAIRLAEEMRAAHHSREILTWPEHREALLPLREKAATLKDKLNAAKARLELAKLKGRQSWLSRLLRR